MTDRWTDWTLATAGGPIAFICKKWRSTQQYAIARNRSDGHVFARCYRCFKVGVIALVE